MNTRIEKLKQLRLFVLRQLAGFSPEQLHFIPAGFSNNIIWNLGHMVSVQHVVCYKYAGLPLVPDERFLFGTKPDGIYDIAAIQSSLIDSVDQLQADYDQHIFSTYTPSPAVIKTYGFAINNIDEALEYLLYHDGYHAGCIASIKRFC